MLHFIKWILIMTGIFAIILIINLVYINNSCSASKKSLLSSTINWVVNTQDSYQKTQEWSLKTTSAPTIDLNNITGSITVKGHDKPECIIKITKHGATEDSLNNVEVVTDFSEEKLSLKTNYLTNNSRSWISYELLVPQKAICTIKNVTGAIEVQNMHNSVNAQNVTGSLNCSLTKLEPKAEINLSTTTGSIELTLPKNTHANVSAETTVGSINSDFPLVHDSTLWTGDSARGVIGANSLSEKNTSISLQATTGSIDIKKQ